MTIVHCFFTMRTGGSQLLTIDMLNSMSQEHQVSLVIINNDWDAKLVKRLAKSIPVYYINRQEGSLNPLPVLRFNALLMQLKPDLIHCHERSLIRLIRFKSAKTLYTIHDVGVATNTFRQYDALVSISQAVASDVQQRANLVTHVIPNGVSINRFRKRIDYTVQAHTALRIVQVSRLVHEKKGQDILLKAFAKLVQKNPSQNLTLDLIGWGDSAAYLQELTVMLGIDKVVNFLGEQNRDWLETHIADYHILIQPSRYEGFGLTVVEGLAAGLPVIASNLEGPAEILQGLSAGTLFTSGDYDDCAAALNRVIQAYYRDEIDGQVAQSREIIAKKYAIETTVNNYLNLYSQLIQSASILLRSAQSIGVTS